MAKVLEAQGGGARGVDRPTLRGRRNTAVRRQVKEIVAKSLNDSRQDLLRQFSAEDGHNPLADFKAEVVREVNRWGDSRDRSWSRSSPSSRAR